jgi:hypothetical protein
MLLELREIFMSFTGHTVDYIKFSFDLQHSQSSKEQTFTISSRKNPSQDLLKMATTYFKCVNLEKMIKTEETNILND